MQIFLFSKCQNIQILPFISKIARQHTNVISLSVYLKKLKRNKQQMLTKAVANAGSLGFDTPTKFLSRLL